MRGCLRNYYIEKKTRNNALFLSVVDQFNGVIAKRIMKWFSNFIAISGLSHEAYEMVTFSMLSKTLFSRLEVRLERLLPFVFRKST